MADENKKVQAEVTDKKAAKAKAAKEKKPSKFNPKNIGKAIARWFKDLKGETKKIVWPGRQMILKSTGVVLASIIVVGAGIWIIDYAISGAVTAVNKAAEKVEETTEAPSEQAADAITVGDESTDEAEDAETTEAETAEKSTDAND